MTMKRLWLTVLISISVISILANGLVIMVLTNQYFKAYMVDVYQTHVEELTTYASQALSSSLVNGKQIAIDLETHLDDPINRIKLFDYEGNMIADVKALNQPLTGMMRGMMSGASRDSQEAVDQYVLTNGKDKVGTLLITRSSAIDNTMITRFFQFSLLKNSGLALLFALSISIIIALLVSKRISKALQNTADFATHIHARDDFTGQKSGILEINIINQSLLDLKDKLNLKQKSRKTVVDELVHQTRTPLTVLKTHLDALEDGLIEMCPEEIQVCQAQIDAIDLLIHNMRDMVDADRTSPVLHLETVDLNKVLTRIIRGLETQFKQKSIALKYQAQHVMINTDVNIFSQAIYNLLTNAYKYTDANGEVVLALEDQEEIIMITVSDNGCGIASKYLEKIFQAYYSVPGETKRGDGLGLYIVASNIALLGGTIEVSSVVNQGTTFSISIPKQEKTSI